MRRYQGEKLPQNCRIAVIASDSLGNYVVTTPLLQMLSEQFQPSALHYFSGERTEELWSRDPKIDWGYAVLQALEGDAPQHAQDPYDLIVNVESSSWAKEFCGLIAHPETFVCGPCTWPANGEDLGFPTDTVGSLAMDTDWTSPNLVARHSCLTSPFIGEILCRLAYLTGPIPPYSVPIDVPPFEIPDVLISTAASLPEKLWETPKWLESLSSLTSLGYTVGIVGANPQEQRQHWQGENTEAEILAHGLAADLRGRLTLPEVVGALKRSRLCFTIDNGILHLACAVCTPTVGLFREGYHRLWSPPVDSLLAVFPEPGSKVSSIQTADVDAAIDSALAYRKRK